jgi:hypothetical protein
MFQVSIVIEVAITNANLVLFVSEAFECELVVTTN